ncbi:MAG: helix-turn-helix domain-containing protein [Candidatus Pseudoscilispira sp.]|nr:helix-turn-helix domain-containing protein [bacterium 210917-SL.2.15]MDY4036893.1 helix-turn-helix domain-containing protein [Candidatus Pseudoscilispira sp.]
MNFDVGSRIKELRIAKGLSTNKMSLDLGHGKNYIRSITSGRTLPSLAELPYICGYLGVSVSGFFDETSKNSVLIQDIIKRAQHLEEADLLAIISIMDRMHTTAKD